MQETILISRSLLIRKRHTEYNTANLTTAFWAAFAVDKDSTAWEQCRSVCQNQVPVGAGHSSLKNCTHIRRDFRKMNIPECWKDCAFRKKKHEKLLNIFV